MKEFARTVVHQQENIFQERDKLPFVATNVGNRSFGYYVIPQQRFTLLPDFALRMTYTVQHTGRVGGIFGVSSDVPEDLRDYWALHEVIEFQELGINQDGRCGNAEQQVLDTFSDRFLQARYVGRRIRFFSHLIPFFQADIEAGGGNYTNDDVVEAEKTHLLLRQQEAPQTQLEEIVQQVTSLTSAIPERDGTKYLHRVVENTDIFIDITYDHGEVSDIVINHRIPQGSSAQVRELTLNKAINGVWLPQQISFIEPQLEFSNFGEAAVSNLASQAPDSLPPSVNPDDLGYTEREALPARIADLRNPALYTDPDSQLEAFQHRQDAIEAELLRNGELFVTPAVAQYFSDVLASL